MNQPAQQSFGHRLHPILLFTGAFLIIVWNIFKLNGKIDGTDCDFKVHAWQTKQQSDTTSSFSSGLSLQNHTVTATTNTSGFDHNNNALPGERTQIKTGNEKPANGTTPTSVVELYHELKALSNEDLLKRMSQLSQEELDEVAKYNQQINAENPKPPRFGLIGYIDFNPRPPTPNDPMFEKTRNMLKQLSREELFNRFNFGQHSMRENVHTQYCEHSTNVNATTDSSCYKLLSPHVKGKRAWFFFGDSQMWRLISRFIYPYPITYTKSAFDHRCGFLDYCYLEKADTWIPPSSPKNQTQGPVNFGKMHPFCADLTSSTNARWESNVPNGTHFIEHLIVEYASDVEQQSIYSNTTQEAAAIHVANQLQLRNLTNDDSVCVVNAGLHDQVLCSGKSDEYCLEIYLNNVNSYLNVLQYVCGNIVWVSTTSVRGDLDQPQRNDSIFLWNQRVNATIMRKYPNAFFLDVWNVSSRSPLQ